MGTRIFGSRLDTPDEDRVHHLVEEAHEVLRSNCARHSPGIWSRRSSTRRLEPSRCGMRVAPVDGSRPCYGQARAGLARHQRRSVRTSLRKTDVVAGGQVRFVDGNCGSAVFACSQTTVPSSTTSIGRKPLKATVMRRCAVVQLRAWTEDLHRRFLPPLVHRRSSRRQPGRSRGARWGKTLSERSSPRQPFSIAIGPRRSPSPVAGVALVRTVRVVVGRW